MTAQTAETGSVDVLIAEDDMVTRWSLRTLLEREGYRCTDAADGGSALESARRSPPRCAILDLAMPVLDGFAVARALRLDPRTRGVRIHCLTGRSDATSRREASEAGIEAFLTKPLDPSRLLQIVQEHFDQPDVLTASGLSLDAVREQLDFWENAGYGGLESAYEDGKGFSVRGVRPPQSSRAGRTGNSSSGE